MLVLSRRLNESVFIGENIKVKIVRIDRNRVRLGIECPTDIPIHRDEHFVEDSEQPKTPPAA